MEQGNQLLGDLSRALLTSLHTPLLGRLEFRDSFGGLSGGGGGAIFSVFFYWVGVERWSGQREPSAAVVVRLTEWYTYYCSVWFAR